MGWKKLALVPIALPFAMYLAGAFACASFDISHWPDAGRALCAMMMFVGAIVGCGLASAINDGGRP